MLSKCCQRFEKPSNETLLVGASILFSLPIPPRLIIDHIIITQWVAFASFLGFTLAQSIVAFIAESQAMMGEFTINLSQVADV